MKNKPKIIFIIGMHRSGTSLLSNCLIKNGFSLGITKNKDKDLQNPNGYFENDAFTKFHEYVLLAYNDSKWHAITKKKMKYTQHQVSLYRQMLKSEFPNEQLLLIKDPRLTFFIDFLKEVCIEYEYYFLFLTRNKVECCNSLNKAQGISLQKCSVLYDKITDNYSKEFLMINHNDIINRNNIVMKNIANHCNIELNNETTNLVDMKLYRNRI
jgi:hypothetical protein